MEASLGEVYSLAFSLDGQWIASFCLGDTVWLSVASTKALFSIPFGYPSSVGSVAFSLDGLQIAVGGHEEMLEANLRSSRSEVQCIIGPVLRTINSPDGQTSLVVSTQKDIYQELTIRIFTTFIDGLCEFGKCRLARV